MSESIEPCRVCGCVVRNGREVVGGLCYVCQEEAEMSEATGDLSAALTDYWTNGVMSCADDEYGDE